VLEVGLGGEFDATNVIKSNLIQIITRLGMDHTQYLGTTLSSVAAAKCGIIKKTSETKTLVTAQQDEEAMAIIEEKCRELDTELVVAKPQALSKEGIYERFSIDGTEFKTGIPGFHQIENSSLAILAARKLGIDESAISRGVSRAKNPARFELIRENPTVIYDGGHNENGITALNFTLERYFGDAPKTIIFACMKDKEIDKSLALLSRGSTEFIFTTVKDNPRAMSACELKAAAESFGFSGAAFEEIGDAYREAVSRGKLTVICGSLYLYKDFREFYDKEC
jgi:dihydrofolate synthase/folylpolyglutamate synthase